MKRKAVFTSLLLLIFICVVEGCQKEIRQPEKRETKGTKPKEETRHVSKTADTNTLKDTPTTTAKSNKKEPIPTTTTPPPKPACETCCDSVQLPISELERLFAERLFGQELAKKTILAAIKGHLSQSLPSKALVLSLHGSSGTGKSHTASLVAQSLYKDGLNSDSVYRVLDSLEDAADPVSLLKEKLASLSSACPRCLVIVEVDLLSTAVLDSLISFVDYRESSGQEGTSSMIFLFLSNRGGREINDIAIEHRESGGRREALQVNDFEKIVTNAAFNESGGLQGSRLVERGLIDVFIPFLPLEQTHVQQCVRAHLQQMGRSNTIEDEQRVARSLQYFGGGAFSSTGCKKVAARTAVVLDDERDEL